MTSYRAINGFYMIKTINGDYIVGLYDKNYNEVQLGYNAVWINEDTMIPYSSIEIYRKNIPYNEFVKICNNAGISDREDVKESLMDYYDHLGLNPLLIKWVRYFNDLKV